MHFTRTFPVWAGGRAAICQKFHFINEVNETVPEEKVSLDERERLWHVVLLRQMPSKVLFCRLLPMAHCASLYFLPLVLMFLLCFHSCLVCNRVRISFHTTGEPRMRTDWSGSLCRDEVPISVYLYGWCNSRKMLVMLFSSPIVYLIIYSIFFIYCFFAGEELSYGL